MTPLPPKKKTLEKYGLSVREWAELVVAQGGVCAICKKLPKSGKLNIDHHHHGSGKWKTWPAERRKLYVRGLLCWTCNKICVGRGVNIAKLRAALAYLEAFHANME